VLVIHFRLPLGIQLINSAVLQMY